MSYLDIRWERCSCRAFILRMMFWILFLFCPSSSRTFGWHSEQCFPRHLSRSTITYRLSYSTVCLSSTILIPFHSNWSIVPYLFNLLEDFRTLKKGASLLYVLYTFVPFSLYFYSFTLKTERYFMLKRIGVPLISYSVCNNIPPSLYSQLFLSVFRKIWFYASHKGSALNFFHGDNAMQLLHFIEN